LKLRLDEMMKEIDVKNKVKLARIEANLTQQELAEMVGVTRQTIGLIEVDKYNPTIKLCLLLSAATGKSLDELFWNEGLDDA
jgi:putative transcriptional regulator